MSRRSHTYRDHCAELKHGVFSARDVFRCEHVSIRVYAHISTNSHTPFFSSRNGFRYFKRTTTAYFLRSASKTGYNSPITIRSKPLIIINRVLIDQCGPRYLSCDNGATTRSLTKARIICDPDEPCRHKGYHALYPRLNNAFSRRRRCFRVLPSSSRFGAGHLLRLLIIFLLIYRHH